MIETLRTALAKREILRIHNPGVKVSAVLVPVFRKDSRYYLLFIRRTERVEHHKGQISFPGGSFKKSDGSLMNTALREAQEEIGLAPKDVDVLGELDDTLTATSNYVISPFVGLIPYPYNFQPDKWETEELLEVPVDILLEKDCFSEALTIQNGREIETCFYDFGDTSIWGATARILQQFLGIYSGLANS
jgi:8-oxo-dGTP pyrophosphatase MutT (NUDIX family)